MLNLEKIFSNVEKEKCFDRLAEKYYTKNFGQLSKVDFELEMFSFYYENARKLKKTISDFEIAKELGISPKKVSNLIFKYELTKTNGYSPEDLKNEIENIVNCGNVHYDKKNERIIMNINNQMLFCELEDYLNTKNKYVEKQLNRNLFQISVQAFCKLIEESLLDKEKKKIKEIIKNNNKISNSIIPIDKIEVFHILCDATNLISEITPIISSPFSSMLKFLSDEILKK